MPTRSAALFALILWVVASLAVGVRSYWCYDVLAVGGWSVGSESGAVYIFPSVETFDHYMTGRAGENGRLEVETGSAYRPWMPGGTWAYMGARFWVAQWWAIAVAGGAALAWLCRRRREGVRGFEVKARDANHDNRSSQ